ncbi:MAG: phosphogluconate dehydratase [Pseudomonadota bacterium]
MSTLQSIRDQICDRIQQRSASTRQAYLKLLHSMQQHGIRSGLSCANLAHAVAGCEKAQHDERLKNNLKNLAIISSYNELLSAHAPYKNMPDLIRATAESSGAYTQFAAGVPAMCDGVTQGQPGMELSLFSRDLIAQATTIGLTHSLFHGTLCLGICDKIVPGLLIGALHFGHLPTVFIPSGPMTTGLSNEEKSKMRKAHAAGEVGDEVLLAVERASYHGEGTCTFYGTANTNQVLLEAMGLQLVGSSFVLPDTQLRYGLTESAVKHLIQHCEVENPTNDLLPFALGVQISAEALINAIIALAASGGSTNHTIHLIAIAQAAGFILNWDDISDISKITPLLARIYPNGAADVNEFHALGGTTKLFRELFNSDLLYPINTIHGKTLDHALEWPVEKNGSVVWEKNPILEIDDSVLRSAQRPFSQEGGLILVQGNIGRAIVKRSAVLEKHWVMESEALVFNYPEDVIAAFHQGALNKDVIIVLRYQGPKANGMPELHGLMPILGRQLDDGYNVALITDGRMSGASGRVPVALHLVPEALNHGLLSYLQSGDRIRLDLLNGTLNVHAPAIDTIQKRIPLQPDLTLSMQGSGRECFYWQKVHVSSAEEGATIFKDYFSP